VYAWAILLNSIWHAPRISLCTKPECFASLPVEKATLPNQFERGGCCATAVRPIQFFRGCAGINSKPFTSIVSSSGHMAMLRAPPRGGLPETAPLQPFGTNPQSTTAPTNAFTRVRERFVK
jgi:hypothetical protein